MLDKCWSCGREKKVNSLGYCKKCQWELLQRYKREQREEDLRRIKPAHKNQVVLYMRGGAA